MSLKDAILPATLAGALVGATVGLRHGIPLDAAAMGAAAGLFVAAWAMTAHDLAPTAERAVLGVATALPFAPRG